MPSVAGELARRGKSWVQRNMVTPPPHLDPPVHSPPTITPFPSQRQKRCIIFVDFDNIEGHARKTKVSYDLDRVITYLQNRTTIGKVAKVVVCRTVVDDNSHLYPNHVAITPSEMYEVHDFPRKKFERGYEDAEIYRLAWESTGLCETIVLMSRDKGFAHAAQQMRDGWNSISGSWVDKTILPQIQLVSTAADKGYHFRMKNGFIDLESILRSLGIVAVP